MASRKVKRTGTASTSRLEGALASSPVLLQKYVAGMREQLLQLQEEQASLELQLMAANGRVKALEKERITPPRPSKGDTIDAARRIAFVLASAGMKIVDEGGKVVRAPKAGVKRVRREP